jgi:hypothetical protein
MSEPNTYLLIIIGAWALICWFGWQFRPRTQFSLDIQPGDVITSCDITGPIIEAAEAFENLAVATSRAQKSFEVFIRAERKYRSRTRQGADKRR